MKTADIENLLTSEAFRFYRAFVTSSSFWSKRPTLESVIAFVEAYASGKGVMVSCDRLKALTLKAFIPDPYRWMSDDRDSFFIIFDDGSMAYYQSAPEFQLIDKILSLQAPLDFGRDFGPLGPVRVVATTAALRAEAGDLQGSIDAQVEACGKDAPTVFDVASQFDYVYTTSGFDYIGEDYSQDDNDALIEALELCWTAVEMPPYTDIEAHISRDATKPLSIQIEGDVDESRHAGERALLEIVSVFVDPMSYLGYGYTAWYGRSAAVVCAHRQLLSLPAFRYSEDQAISNHQRLTARAKILEACEKKGSADLAARLEADWTLGLNPDD